MKIRFKFPPDGQKDAFSYNLIRMDWTFKLCIWLILIGTLKYAGEVTGRGLFTFLSLALSIEIVWLIYSFIYNRFEFELVSYEGKYRWPRIILNSLVAGIIAGGTWYLTLHMINQVIADIV